jgi:hypothetical protein
MEMLLFKMKSWQIVIFLIISISCFIFAFGYHNVDLAYNMRLGAIDCGNSGCIDINQRYSQGLDEMTCAFVLVFAMSYLAVYLHNHKIYD